MATYVALFNWTDQGIRSYKDSPSRAQAAAAEFTKLGVTLKDLWWTLGPYDLAAVFEAPDDETVTAAMLALGSAGNVRTTTMRAFDRNEFGALVAKTG